MKKMTKTNGKYTYKDMLLRKRILKREIKDIEGMATSPKSLGFIGGTLKDKTLDFIKYYSAGSGIASILLNLVIDTGLGLGVEKIVSKISGKKNPLNKIILVASGYLIPFVVNKSKEIIEKKVRKKKDTEI